MSFISQKLPSHNSYHGIICRHPIYYFRSGNYNQSPRSQKSYSQGGDRNGRQSVENRIENGISPDPRNYQQVIIRLILVSSNKVDILLGADGTSDDNSTWSISDGTTSKSK